MATLPAARWRCPSGAERSVPQAWLVAAKDTGGLSEFDRLILHQAVTVIALELLRRHVAETTERRLAGDVLAEIVSGGWRAPSSRAGSSRSASAAASPRSCSHRASATSEPARRRVNEALREEAVSALVAAEGAHVCALLPGLLDDELFELAGRVSAKAEEALRRPLPAGAGRAVAAGDARRAFHEARCALEARQLGAQRERPASAGVATFRDLGSFQLLLSLQDSDALRLFCESLLGPIESGEGHYGGELMRSLEAFIECNGQWEAAARRLYCHRHTLRYRIRKIEELTGRDLTSARDRIEFWLALRGRELVTNQ